MEREIASRRGFLKQLAISVGGLALVDSAAESAHANHWRRRGWGWGPGYRRGYSGGYAPRSSDRGYFVTPHYYAPPLVPAPVNPSNYAPPSGFYAPIPPML
jgi:hypothetical protein